MNRIIASVGLVALGAASVQAQSSSITPPPAKWWNVSATVRGFYDDNIDTVPNSVGKTHAWGYELSPKVGVTLGNDQTTFTAEYKYSFLDYDHKLAGNSTHYDQDHIFNALLTHAFNERYSVRVRDSFVIGQEPEALRWDAAFHTPFRVSGDNIMNSGGITFEAELTPLLGLELGYDNNWVDYHDRFGLAKNSDGTDVTFPSLSGALDRIEQWPHLSLLWHVQRDTTASLSYQFGQINYTGDEPLFGPLDAPIAKSSDRDSRVHRVYVGLDHKFNPDFYGSVQAGASYYDYYNVHVTSFGPYAKLSLTYVYMPESSVEVGFQESRAATDVVGGGVDLATGQFLGKSQLVHDAEDSVVYGALHQRIIPKLYGNLRGSYQHSSFNGGGPEFNHKTEDFFEFGADLDYRFNVNFSAQVGYDYDRLCSEIAGRTYTRNKVYIGATASY